MSALVAGRAAVEVVPTFKGFVTSASAESRKAGQASATAYNSELTKGTNKPGLWKRTGSRMASAIGGALKTGLKVGVAGAVALIGYSLTKGFQRLSAIDQAQAKLTGLGNSGKQVDAIMKNALASVKGTAFGMDEAATTAAGAVAAGVKPGKDLERTLKLTADAATIAGVSMGDMGSIFNKVATSNKIQGDTIAQLSDAGIPVVQMLSKVMGTSAEETVKLASAGKINFATFQKAMEKGLGGAALSSGKTFTGAMSNLKASLGRIGANLLGGIFPHLAPWTTKLTNAMAPLEDKAKVIGDKIGIFLAGGLKKLPGIIDSLKAAWQGGQVQDSGFLGTIQKVVAWMGIHVPPAVQSIKSFFKSGSDGKASKMGSVLSSIGQSLQKFFSNFDGANIKDFFSSLGKSAPVFNSTLQITGVVLGTIADHADLVAKAMPLLLAGFAAYKTAQIANNVVGQNSLIGSTLRTAALFSGAAATRANAAATREHTAALLGDTASTGANNASQSVGILARIRGTVATVASNIATRAAAAASRVAAAGQWLLNAALSANPIGLVVIAIAALVAGLVLAYTKVGWFRNMVNAAFTFVINIATTVLNFFKNNWKNILVFLTGPIGIAVSLISKHWKSIQGFFSKAWKWVSGIFKNNWRTILSILAGPLVAAALLVQKHWGTIKGHFSAAVNWVKGAFKATWNGISYVLTHPIDAAKKTISRLLGATGLRSVFSAARDAIGRIWSGISGKITGPIRSVLGWVGSHFVNPLNSLLSKVGLGKHFLPWPSFAGGGSVGHGGGHVPRSAYASGGVLPGYSPGKDNMHWYSPLFGGLSLSGGEGIVRPEVVRGMGAGLFNKLNAAARNGGVRAVRRMMGFASGGILPHHSYGIGGIIDWGKDAVSDAASNLWSGVEKVGGFAVDMGKMLVNPLSAIKTLGNKLLGGISSSMWGQATKGALVHGVEGLAKKVEDALGFGGNPGGGDAPGDAGGKGGRGWQWQWGLIHRLFPGVSLTSAYRPGARTAGSGSVSYHALGRAIDLGGPVPLLKRVAQWILKNYGSRSGDLLYSPLWGRMGIYHGKWYPQPAVTVAQHGNHIHWGYKRGGVLGGYANGTMNASRGVRWVGENGPELMWFNGGERVMSHYDSRQLINATRRYRSSPNVGGGRYASQTDVVDALRDALSNVRVVMGTDQVGRLVTQYQDVRSSRGVGGFEALTGGRR